MEANVQIKSRFCINYLNIFFNKTIVSKRKELLICTKNKLIINKK